jgi:hypothetical protein
MVDQISKEQFEELCESHILKDLSKELRDQENENH